MSSQPDKTPRRRIQFEQWRKVMLLGALILLANAVADAVMDGPPPRWLSMLLLVLGYGLLAVGFGIRMRAVKEERERVARAEKGTGGPGDR